MIFDGKLANFKDFSLNFCQQVDFLPQGGFPRIFRKQRMKFQSLLVRELELWREEERPSEKFYTNLILGVEEIVEGRIAFPASMEMANKIALSRTVSMT